MKWLKFLFLSLLLCACQGESVEEFKIERHPIKEQSGSMFYNLTEDIIEKRVDLVLDNEIASVNVYNGDYVVSVDDEGELEKFKQYLAEKTFNEFESESYIHYLTEVNCKGKDPIYFDMYVCEYKSESDQPCDNVIGKLQGEKTELKTSLDNDITNYKVWADEIEIEEKEEVFESDVLWVTLHTDEWNEDSVIDEELVSALLEKSYEIHCYDSICEDSFDSKIKINDLPEDHSYLRIYGYRPKSSFDQLIADTFVGRHEIRFPNWYQYNEQKRVYEYNGTASYDYPVREDEYYPWREDYYAVIDERVNGNEQIVKIVKYGMEKLDREKPIYLIYDYEDHYFITDENQTIRESILENQSRLNQYEIVLQDGKLKSMKCVHTPDDIPLQPLDESKDVFYLKNRSGIVNFNTVDAQLFNAISIYHEYNENLRYKTNVYDHYLNILLRYGDDVTDAYVFDINTGLLVSDEELMEVYQIDKEKIRQTVYKTYNYCEEKRCLTFEPHSWSLVPSSNAIFISSSGKPTVVLNNIDETDVLIMEWEEVQ